MAVCSGCSLSIGLRAVLPAKSPSWCGARPGAAGAGIVFWWRRQQGVGNQLRLAVAQRLEPAPAASAAARRRLAYVLAPHPAWLFVATPVLASRWVCDRGDVHGGERRNSGNARRRIRAADDRVTDRVARANHFGILGATSIRAVFILDCSRCSYPAVVSRVMAVGPMQKPSAPAGGDMRAGCRRSLGVRRSGLGAGASALLSLRPRRSALEALKRVLVDPRDPDGDRRGNRSDPARGGVA